MLVYRDGAMFYGGVAAGRVIVLSLDEYLALVERSRNMEELVRLVEAAGGSGGSSRGPLKGR